MRGGRGGHSGGDIAAGRANAIKLLGHALRGAGEVRIAAFDGGASRNAIPRDAVALVAGDGVRAAVEAADAAARRTYARTDPGVRIAAEPAGADPAGRRVDRRGERAAPRPRRPRCPPGRSR